jgi:pimeloyl-ACP methyl ester carboxylesterase
MISILVIVLLLIGLGLIAAHLYSQNLAHMSTHAVPRAGEVMAVPGGRIHYVEMGKPDGVPVVLIHGLGGFLQHMTYALADELADTFRVIAVDRPGCGYSSREQGHAELPAQAAMLGAFMDGLGLERPVLVGHSLGGAVALEIAVARPAEVGALALICPLTHREASPPDVFKGLAVRNPALRALLGGTIASPMAKATTEKALTEVFKPEAWPPDFALRAGGLLTFKQGAFAAASEDLEAAETAMKRLPGRYADELKVPGGVLYGAADNLLSPGKHGKSMQAHGLDYEELPGKGHMIPLTEPAATADFVRRMAAKRTA